MPHRPMKHITAQRGAATLVFTLALFAAMVLVVAYVNRNLVFEQRASANQARATQAFEAAETGLEWAQAQLNATGRTGTDCRPSSDASALPFRERALTYRRADASFVPATWLQGGVAVPRQAACVRVADGWQCSCPDAAMPAVAGPIGAPAFTVQFMATGNTGVVRLHATGCIANGSGCTADATAASAQTDVALGLVPGLKTPPAAALTVRGSLDAGTAALGAQHADVASGGFAIHTGGALTAPHARVAGPAGAVADDAVVANDSTLAALEADDFFAAHFGMPLAAWVRQPVVGTVTCSANCAAALEAAVGEGITDPLVHVQGDLPLDGPVVLGTPERPVLIVVDGAAQLRGAVTVHGLLYARSLRWDDSAAGAQVRGAALVEGDYRGNGTPDFTYDAAVLALLKGRTGAFARVNGSWRDF